MTISSFYGPFVKRYWNKSALEYVRGLSEQAGKCAGHMHAETWIELVHAVGEVAGAET
ncbi:hypothetical protein [Rhodopila globiformis]|uniref:hypothetical protein n=1 Tax=Rhodopila globiformis TaxID=1071 RepID=UPI001304F00A|nr:hypothetical protein [Rhodopila globiformis]